MTRRNILIALLACLVGGFCGWWLYNNLEYTTTRIWRGYMGEAQTNHLLAAEHFLNQLGVDAHSIEGPQDLDKLSANNGTLLITTGRTTLGDQRNQALLAWVEGGGHLILQPKRPIPGAASEPDPLLDPFNVNGHHISQDFDFDPEELAIPESASSQCGNPATYMDLPDSEDPLEIDYYQWQILETENLDSTWSYEDEDGLRVLQYAHGKGHVTILSDMAFFNNSSIEAYDHAYFLYWLAQARPGPFWIMHTDDLPPLWLWVWQRAPAIVVAAGLLLLFWLLLAPRRFGPLLPPLPSRRRRIMEHIEAGGHYLWGHGQADILLKGLREALHMRLHQIRPDLAGLPADQLSRRLADITGISAQKIQHALVDAAATKRDNFTHQTQILENIRKQL